MTDPVAFVRAVPDSFAEAIVQGRRPVIDVARARAQHEAYRATLAETGYRIEIVAADPAHPDCPFIEDVAVVLDHVAVVTRPGAEARRGEIEPVATALAAARSLRRIEPPGTLDGGDVLVVGRTLYVGRSRRTNQDGIDQLAAIATEGGYGTVAVDVDRVLHLKSAVSLLDDETVLIGIGAVDPSAFADMRQIRKAEADLHLASTLRLRDGRLLMTHNAHATAERVAAAGFDVAPIDMSEFQAADGGLTCLSILVEG
jgi:dimethylargininase